MLTIKHIDDAKVETVVCAVSIRFDPNRVRLIGYGTDGREEHVFTTGHAFVMNDAGKTCGAYNLKANIPSDIEKF